MYQDTYSPSRVYRSMSLNRLIVGELRIEPTSKASHSPAPTASKASLSPVPTFFLFLTSTEGESPQSLGTRNRNYRRTGGESMSRALHGGRAKTCCRERSSTHSTSRMTSTNLTESERSMKRRSIRSSTLHNLHRGSWTNGGVTQKSIRTALFLLCTKMWLYVHG